VRRRSDGQGEVARDLGEFAVDAEDPERKLFVWPDGGAVEVGVDFDRNRRID
jgi:hypothetical protein